MAKYICNGAQCKCTMGTDKGTLDVKSQNKIFIQDKLMATENENTFLPNFVNCNKTNPPTPCQPTIETPWTSTKSNVFQSEHKGLLEASTATCTFGNGTISILDSKQSDTKNVIFGDYSSEPKEISKVYAKVRTLETYNGEFGFDWVDVDPETMEIQKIQGVPFEKVEYFYKKGNTTPDLGNIIPIGEDKPAAIQAIQRNYDLINFSDYVDTPFILIKPGEQATLSLEVFFEGESQDDYISITGDEYYSFKIDGEEKRKDENDKTTKKKIVAKEQLQLTINCSKESLDKKYYFLHTGVKGPREIGGLNMMENKVLKLKFRVIALVSNEGNPSAKAKALFAKFRDNGITEYLNKNSLNQAGYKVEIENQEIFKNLNYPDVNIDDYFYAFDKEDWKRKNYLGTREKQRGIIDANGNTPIGPDGNYLQEKYLVDTLFKTINKDSIDYLSIEEYSKKISKPYTGGVIILADGECMETSTGAFSRTLPINHNAIFVYSTNIENKDTYSHEIGHLLGLEHSFIEIDVSTNKNDIKEYEDKKEEITEYTNLKIKYSDIVIQEERSNHSKPIGKQNKIVTEYKEPRFVKKNTLLNCIENSNRYFDLKIRDYNFKIDSVKNNAIYTMPKKDADGNWILQNDGKTVKQFPTTPALFRERLKEQKMEYTKYQEKNILSKNIAQKISNNEFIKFSNEFDLIAEDSLKIYIDYLNKLNKEWEQMISNYLYFKKGSTKNIMDYIDQRRTYLNNQIIIMRNDYENN